MFSVCYRVKAPNGAEAFLKALDFKGALSSRDPARELERLTVAFNYERDILIRCKDMDHIVRVLDSGIIDVGGTYGVVQYLIFEKADRDVRDHLNTMDRTELFWKLQCLHDIATGLNELHTARIAHQDLKPSNVLVFEKIAKLSDLGCASYYGVAGPRDWMPFVGDATYAPPELLYGYNHSHWDGQRIGCDVYLLGSMACYFLTGVGTTSLLLNGLSSAQRPRVLKGSYTGSFDDILPILEHSFANVLRQIGLDVANEALRSELTGVIRELCHPDPRRRGLPEGLRGIASPFGLERYISKFNLLANRVRLGFYRE